MSEYDRKVTDGEENCFTQEVSTLQSHILEMCTLNPKAGYIEFLKMGAITIHLNKTLVFSLNASMEVVNILNKNKLSSINLYSQFSC